MHARAAASSRKPARRNVRAPLLAPLTTSVNAVLGPDAEQAPPSSPANPTRLAAARRLVKRTVATTSVVTCLYGCAKALGRLLSSGQPGMSDGFALLPLESSPPEVIFWVLVIGSIAFAEAERRLSCAVIARAAARAADDDCDGKSPSAVAADSASSDRPRRAPRTKAEAAAELASDIKRSYVDDTTPKAQRALTFILRMMQQDSHLLALAYSSLVIAAAGEASVPFLYGRVIDSIALSRPSTLLGAASQQSSEFLKNIGLLLICALVTGIFTGLRGSTFTYIGGRFGKRLRVRLFEALLRQELDFFSAVKTGDVVSRLSSDCQKVSDQVQLNVNVFLRSLIQVFFTLGFMLYISPRLMMACFVIIPAIVGISKVFADFMRALSTETQDSLADANSLAEEVLSGIASARAFSAEADEVLHYADGMSAYVGCVWRQAKLYFMYSSLTFTFLPYLTYALVLFFAAQLSHSPPGCGPKGSGAPPCGIDGPGLVSFVFYMQSLFSSFQSLGNIYTALAQAVGAADKVVAWIDRAPVVAQPASGQGMKPARCSGEIALRDVTFRYRLRPDKAVLSGFSLRAAPGEVVALCGPSGGGKSSIIALLERFYEPEAGQVLLDGIPIGSLDPGWFHQRVALVGQEPVLFGRSIADNIVLGMEAPGVRPTQEGIERAATLANAHTFISEMQHGYQTVIGERGSQLSGGQKQRVAIARALVRQPAVLLLDEATSALDADSEAVVQEAIDTLIARGGLTVIMIAHRLSTIRNADRICLIRDGRLVEQGTHDELIRRGEDYARLVSRQMSGAPRTTSATSLASAGASMVSLPDLSRAPPKYGEAREG